MTTATYTSVIDHTSDAGFRAWGSQFAATLALVGLVQTADTGQVNWATVTRPGVSTMGGYEIWRFADSSLYIRFEYWTGGNANGPAILLTVGTGSNGSGTLTGQTSQRLAITQQSVPVSTVTTFTTYMCATADAWSVVWKMNGISSAYPMGYAAIGKTVDSTGVATTTGFGVMHCQSLTSVPTMQSVRIASPAAFYTDNTTFICFPGTPASSTVPSGDIQAYQTWLNVPQIIPFAWACGYIQAEIPKANTFPVAMVGSASHTYIAIGQLGGGATVNGQSATVYSLGLIYE